MINTLLRTLEVPGSYLDLVTDCPLIRFRAFPIPSGQMSVQCLKLYKRRLLPAIAAQPILHLTMAYLLLIFPRKHEKKKHEHNTKNKQHIKLVNIRTSAHHVFCRSTHNW